MPETHYENIHFSGRVQGVGFRYATLQAAKEFEVSGVVRNLDDGRVQLEVEGRPGEVEAFVAEIGERLHGHIRSTERRGGVREARFSGFSIQ
ncbi:MAG: acylphosphatase [Opitutaceae bacterium]|jgi:acylphosphatase|nr:acylphosphatase [Opitutaceae bacterium]